MDNLKPICPLNFFKVGGKIMSCWLELYVTNVTLLHHIKTFRLMLNNQHELFFLHTLLLSSNHVQLGQIFLSIPQTRDILYHTIPNNPELSDRQVWANSVDPWSWSSLIWVYTICHSVCIFWLNYYLIKPHCLQYRNDSKVSDRQVCANSVNPDQTARARAVWSGSTLFTIPSASFGCITL